MNDARPPHADTFDPAGEGWSHVPEGGFIGLVGPVWSRTEESGRRFGFLAEARHANTLGVVQGGMLMTFADRAMGTLAWEAAGRPCVTASFDMQFAGAGRIGSFLTLDGEIVRRTASLVFVRSLLRSGAAVIGSAQGSWKILSERRRPPSAEPA